MKIVQLGKRAIWKVCNMKIAGNENSAKTKKCNMK